MKSYTNGAPLYVTDPERSCLRVISTREFGCLSEKEQQNIMKTKDILVYADHEIVEPPFDRRLLLTMTASMTRCFTVHGMPPIQN
jgi:hypothetical protein